MGGIFCSGTVNQTRSDPDLSQGHDPKAPSIPKTFW